jgi:type IX secretion system PorP/SprF family membrane protein
MAKESFPQADISNSSNWYNRAGFNPASITRDDYLYIFSNIRQQWIGIEGAPTTLTLQGSQYIRDLKSAFGFSLIGDKIGVHQTLNPMFSYAYRIIYDRHKWISMGLSAGIYLRSYNGAKYEAEMLNDPSIIYDFNTIIWPDIHLGFEHQTKHFIYSISSTHLPSIWKNDSLFLFASHRYGSIIYKSTDFKRYNYSIGVQAINKHNQFLVEGNACLRIKHQTGLISGPREILELGLTCRSSGILTFLFGTYVTPDCKIGYSFSQSFIPGYYANGTHEILFEYRIPKKAAFMRNYHDRENWYN